MLSASIHTILSVSTHPIMPSSTAHPLVLPSVVYRSLNGLIVPPFPLVTMTDENGGVVVSKPSLVGSHRSDSIGKLVFVAENLIFIHRWTAEYE